MIENKSKMTAEKAAKTLAEYLNMGLVSRKTAILNLKKGEQFHENQPHEKGVFFCKYCNTKNFSGRNDCVNCGAPVKKNVTNELNIDVDVRPLNPVMRW